MLGTMNNNNYSKECLFINIPKLKFQRIYNSLVVGESSDMIIGYDGITKEEYIFVVNKLREKGLDF